MRANDLFEVSDRHAEFCALFSGRPEWIVLEKSRHVYTYGSLKTRCRGDSAGPQLTFCEHYDEKYA
jgi:hypothetical protein